MYLCAALSLSGSNSIICSTIASSPSSYSSRSCGDDRTAVAAAVLSGDAHPLALATTSLRSLPPAKLRCGRPKEDDTSSPCTRCLRIQYPCLISTAKLLGEKSYLRRRRFDKRTIVLTISTILAYKPQHCT